MTNTGIAYFCLVFVMSIVTFIIYGFDKRQAGNGGRRVSERTLHILAFLSGWPGALLAQRQFRHKNQKVSFLVAFWIVVVMHLVVVGSVSYAVYGSTPN